MNQRVLHYAYHPANDFDRAIVAAVVASKTAIVPYSIDHRHDYNAFMDLHIGCGQLVISPWLVSVTHVKLGRSFLIDTAVLGQGQEAREKLANLAGISLDLAAHEAVKK